MIRVLHVMGELRASGAETMLATVGGLWERYGVMCDVVATGEHRGAYGPVLEEAGYGVHHLPLKGNIRYLWAYAELIRSGAYEVVHVHTERASVYLCVAARLAGARVVRTVHNAFPFEGRLARRRTQQRRLARAMGTRFVSIGPTVEGNERERFQNPTDRIDNWVDVARFSPPSANARESSRRRLGVPEGALAVATVGNCSHTKNHVSLLEALVRIVDLDWVWLHVGEEDGERTEQQLASTLGVEQQCRFLGRSRPLDALYAADLYAMPSLYEGLGLSTIEALATGLPVVLTDVPGNRDLRDITDRMLWATTEVESISSALRTMMLDVTAEDSTTVRWAQHEAVSRRYGPDAGVSAYSRVYAYRPGT